MIKYTTLFFLVLLLCSCGGNQYGKASYSSAPTIINVSEYDPKEKQRSGRSYTPLDQSALKANGSLGLIARCAKGSHIDTKCADFLVGAERQGMIIGSYYYVLPGESAKVQAHRYINRLRQIKSNRGLTSDKILMVADMHTKLQPSVMVSFIKEVRQLTGVYPVVYIENSSTIRARLRSATSSQKSTLRKCPYWLALYSNTHNGLKTPQQLTDASDVWSTWAMWQYGGVWWENGRSKPHHYRGGSWRTPKYFGNLDRPIERNGFNGSTQQLYAFWDKHSWRW